MKISFPAFINSLLFICTFFLHPVLNAGEYVHFREIPFYIEKLKKTDLEDKRVEYSKIIHDSIVNADIGNSSVARRIQKQIPALKAVIEDGLDRKNITDQFGWIASAVDFFEKEKLRPIVDIPVAFWRMPQTKSDTGVQISAFPNRVLLHEKGLTITLTASTNIHEAIISPDGKYAAFFRTKNSYSEPAEVWVMDLKKRRGKKVADLPSCQTILFSNRSDRLLIQEKPASPNEESQVYKTPVRKADLTPLFMARRLETVVEKGPHKDQLIVYKKSAHPLGNPFYECPYAFKLSGREIGRIKGGPCR